MVRSTPRRPVQLTMPLNKIRAQAYNVVNIRRQFTPCNVRALLSESVSSKFSKIHGLAQWNAGNPLLTSVDWNIERSYVGLEDTCDRNSSNQVRDFRHHRHVAAASIDLVVHRCSVTPLTGAVSSLKPAQPIL